MEFLRKPIVKIAAVLFILLTIFVLILLFYINQNLSNPLPALYVDGAYIKRSDTQQPVLLKGAVSVSFSVEREMPFSETIEVLEADLATWKMNLLRVLFDAVAIMNPSQYQDLDSLIDYAEKRGMYIILDPVQIDYKSADLPDERVIAAMQFLAERYNSKAHIMYGLWGGQGDVTWDQWLVWARRIATSIREKNPNAVLLLSGTNWGRDFRDFANKMGEFPFQNFALEVRDQHWPDLDIRLWWTQFVGKLPIIVVEFGAGSDKSCEKGSRCDLGYIIETLKIVNKGDQGGKRDTPLLHYTYLPLDGLVKDEVLTDWGEIISSDLKNYPPTDFRKKKFFLF